LKCKKEMSSNVSKSNKIQNNNYNKETFSIISLSSYVFHLKLFQLHLFFPQQKSKERLVTEVTK